MEFKSLLAEMRQYNLDLVGVPEATDLYLLNCKKDGEPLSIIQVQEKNGEQSVSALTEKLLRRSAAEHFSEHLEHNYQESPESLSMLYEAIEAILKTSTQ